MSTATRQVHLESIANTISDYRSGDIATPTPRHVDTWVKQFDKVAQEDILAEMDHVLKNTYIPRAQVEAFLKGLVSHNKITGGDPCSFWKSSHVLKCQAKGGSQSELLSIFDSALSEKCGHTSASCTSTSGPFIYIDDGIYTGMRVIEDLKQWVQTSAPSKCDLHVVVIVLHRGGQYYASKTLDGAAKKAGKTITFTWWRINEIENRLSSRNSSDVLWPTALPNDPDVQAYAKSIEDAKYPLQFRQAGSIGEAKFYSSDAGRQLLEQEFLKAGVRIRNDCPGLNVYQRPLGNMVLKSLGFGAVIVTFRNCANNCPLAWWAGDPWYPLFPRKTN